MATMIINLEHALVSLIKPNDKFIMFLARLDCSFYYYSFVLIIS